MEKHHTDKEFGRKRRQTEIDCCNPYETNSIFQLFQVENNINVQE